MPEYYVAGCNEQIAGSQQTRTLLEQILGQSYSRAICGVLCRTFDFINLKMDFVIARLNKNVNRNCQNTTWQVVMSKLQGASKPDCCWNKYLVKVVVGQFAGRSAAPLKMN